MDKWERLLSIIVDLQITNCVLLLYNKIKHKEKYIIKCRNKEKTQNFL